MTEKTPFTTQAKEGDVPDGDRAYYAALARKFLAEPFPPGSLRPLRRQVRRALRQLRRAGQTPKAPGQEPAFREWLDDNYHLLAREGEQAAADLRFAGRQPCDGIWPATCLLLRKLVQERGVPDEQGIETLVQEAERLRPLTVFELEQLPLCLKAALILTAADACREKGAEGTRLIAAAVNGLRSAADMDFTGLTERHSIVERILREDPAGVYAQMDDLSRADYRRRTALAALRTGRSEAVTAAALVDKARGGSTPRERHVGAPLAAFGDTGRRRARGRALLFLTAVLPALAAVLLAVWAGSLWAAPLLFLPFYELLRPAVQHIVLHGLTPRRLPRLKLEGVIPEEGRTVIAVSSLLPSAKGAKKTAEHLFQLYNTNGRGAVQICLLADLSQAEYPTLPKDDADIAAMRREIRRLNRRCGGRFLLLVRPREYSRTMRAYTGRERKRGAIAELIRVIRGGESRFLAAEGDLSALRRAKYLLALDADTGLLMDTAAELVGVALHPLNQAVLGTGRGGKPRVVRGYGVFVPRMEPELQSANRTPFSRAMAGRGGVAPYDTPAGDPYMDCFSAGIFAGKGLIDIAAFAASAEPELPPEQVLSHDILEGSLLRAGLVSDVAMTDGCPAAMGGWLDRLHRWIRGDWQNAPFLWDRALPLTRLDKYKLLDNLRRAMTPAASLLCLLLSPLFGGRAGQLLALAGLLAPIAGNLLAALLALVHGGWLTLGGRYYSRVLPRAMGALTQAGYTLVMLPACALSALDAAGRAVTRLFTRRNLLEWTTAAQAEKRRSGWRESFARFWPALLVAALLLVGGRGFARLGGLIFLLLIPLSVFSARPSPDRGVPALTAGQKERLSAYAAAMWRYYEEHCTAADHYLPPDNLQESPVWRVAHRTSPTNIGLYLLCIAAARDFGLIDDDRMLDRVERTLATVQKLEKWKGNPYNWYDTRTLRPLSPRYISTVDSGNFVCCLVALRQALAELRGARAEAAAAAVRRLQEGLELAPLYNERRALFHIGLDPDTGRRSPSYYDLLMSESRMTGYYAVATRQIPKKHWGALGRTLARSGSSVGPVSWSGTMFEFFMPRLLLPAQEGTMGYEALRFCLHCQRRRTRNAPWDAAQTKARRDAPRDIPWGISESGFYAFDRNLNYQYKAHGVPRLALKRGLGGELVVSPYSSFLALTTDPDAALRNLSRLERLGLTGGFGFYEAADFTPSRAARGGYSVVRSYMAHHIGMSLIACANAAMDDLFVRRFLRDPDMSRARELLDEKAPDAGTVYDPVREGRAPVLPGREAAENVEIPHPNPRTPRMHLLSGAEWQLAISDTGAGFSCSHGVDIHRASGDLLRAPQGIFALVDSGQDVFSITAAPDYLTGGGTVSRHVTFSPGAAVFTAQQGELEAGMRAMVHPRLPCEQRQVVLKNRSARKQRATLLFYLEPSLARRTDAEAHPAFSRLFLAVQKDEAAGALFVTRRQRPGEAPVCLAAGLLDGEAFEYEPSRETLLVRPQGIASLPGAVVQPFSCGGSGVPDCAVAIRLTLELPARGQRSATLVLAAAPTRAEAANRLVEARREGLLSPGRAAPSPFGGVEAQLAAQILPDLFYPPRMDRDWAAAARENIRGREALWALGVSGDFPIILVEIHNAADAGRAEPYMRLHRSLRLGGVETELCIAYREGGEYDAPVLDALRAAADNAGCPESFGARGGIHLINLRLHGEEALSLLAAVCRHNSARDLQRAGLPPAEYRPAPILPAAPAPPSGEAVGREEAAAPLALPGGEFVNGRFRIREKPRLPWCHLLANPAFGTLVSDLSLGFTWAVNARENKLTPWSNDTASDNRGELLFLRAGGQIRDAVWGASPTFGQGFARYEGMLEFPGGAVLKTTVTVRVPVRGPWKTVEAVIENQGKEDMDMQAAYYTEPALGVNRDAARLTAARWESGALVLHNPFAAVKGAMVLTAEGGADGCDCDRGGFLAGRWGSGTLSPLPDPCAAVIVRRRLPPRRREKITFVLGYAAAREPEAAHRAALALPGLALRDTAAPAPALPRLHTPDPALNALAGDWIPRQALYCRIYARTGFYQCGGAWGFRDQLQDCLAALWIDPALLRRQLIRCAAVQFEQGDVLHWWHRLPGSLRGVRTRCSDDLAWLPYAAAEYVDFTGDAGILDIKIRWLSGPELGLDEQDRYHEPARTDYADPLYLHCVRALERAATRGAHGLPLIGSGDWNDGFNLAGAEGKGESVWLGMFLALTLERFAPLCERRGDEARAQAFRRLAAGYHTALEGCYARDRYLRAFLDDGSPLGAPGTDACALDSLTQSFALLCGLDRERANTALDTALAQLVDRENGVIRLFTPPFGKAEQEPPVGYTTAYPPGVRENGGQYTHAAVWLAIALLKAGRADEGAELLRLLNTAQKYADGLGEQYRGEPYALAGDVYANAECPGRAGWTQYTGSAGWYYTAVLRHLLGLHPHGDWLELSPRLPGKWEGYEASLTLGGSALAIRVRRGKPLLTVDGRAAERIPLDGAPHTVELRLPPAPGQ
ncbi:MAG TPA: DUF3131 domain-containing protein [Firmicutes bacterium]|nr:DUF3131 domain-containing protein [Bacillota bacterium]